MYCTCLLHVLYMFIACTVHVYCMYCTCLLHVLYMFIACVYMYCTCTCTVCVPVCLSTKSSKSITPNKYSLPSLSIIPDKCVPQAQPVIVFSFIFVIFLKGIGLGDCLPAGAIRHKGLKIIKAKSQMVNRKKGLIERRG